MTHNYLHDWRTIHPVTSPFSVWNWGRTYGELSQNNGEENGGNGLLDDPLNLGETTGNIAIIFVVIGILAILFFFSQLK